MPVLTTIIAANSIVSAPTINNSFQEHAITNYVIVYFKRTQISTNETGTSTLMAATINSPSNTLHITQQVWELIQNRCSLFVTDLFIYGLFKGSFINPDKGVLIDTITAE
jgi:hypothetical protein